MLCPCFSHCQLNIAVETVALLLRYWEVIVSNLDPEAVYSNTSSVVLLSI